MSRLGALGRRPAVRLVAAVVLVTMLSVLWTTTLDAGPRSVKARGPVQEIIRDPDRFYGKRVRFDAEVSRQIDHRVWEMAGGRLFLIRDEPVRPAPTVGEVLRIWGTPRPFTPQVIEVRLGINIEDHFFTDDFLADDVAVVVDRLLRLEWPVPLPRWFWAWARWYLDRGEFANDGRSRSSVDRPRGAPLPVPDWAWRRLLVMRGG